jgi:hypothetical protein
VSHDLSFSRTAPDNNNYVTHHHFELFCSFSREALIERTLADIKGFDRAKAEAEVDKFLLDSEAVGMMIQFQKMKAEDPDFKVPDDKEDEGLFSFKNIVSLYAVYFVATTGSTAFRKYVAGQEAAGEWSGTGIPFVDDWIANTAAVAVSSETVQSAVDTVQAVADAVQSS